MDLEIYNHSRDGLFIHLLVFLFLTGEVPKKVNFCLESLDLYLYLCVNIDNEQLIQLNPFKYILFIPVQITQVVR